MKIRLLPLLTILLLLAGCSPYAQQDLQRGTATAPDEKTARHLGGYHDCHRRRAYATAR